MNIQHLNVKWFVEEPQRIDLSLYATIFNEWIQQQAGEELLIDVADYRHVPNGPGVLLIGHEANYSMDSGDGRLGLLYNRKAAVDGAPAERIARAIQTTLQAGRRLMEHRLQQGILTFDNNELLFTLNDRLLGPNDETTYQAFVEALRVTPGLSSSDCAFKRLSQDPRQRLAVQVVSSKPFVAEL